eukprot:930080-Rhodomonas_salina.1
MQLHRCAVLFAPGTPLIPPLSVAALLSSYALATRSPVLHYGLRNRYGMSGADCGAAGTSNVALLVAIGCIVVWGVKQTIQQMQHMVPATPKSITKKTRKKTEINYEKKPTLLCCCHAAMRLLVSDTDQAT